MTPGPDPRAKAYVAIVATPDGGSAFQDGSLDLEARVVAQTLPPLGVAQLSGVGGVLFLSGGAFESPPHPAPRRQWVIPLRGELMVTVSDGTCRRFGPGDLVLEISPGVVDRPTA